MRNKETLESLLLSYLPHIKDKDKKEYEKSIKESLKYLETCTYLLGYWNREVGPLLFSLTPVEENKLQTGYWVWSFNSEEEAQEFADHLGVELKKSEHSNT